MDFSPFLLTFPAKYCIMILNSKAMTKRTRMTKAGNFSRQRDGGWCKPCADLCEGLWLLSRCVETASANADGG